MTNFNAEDRYHPENREDRTNLELAHDTLDVISDLVSDLGKYSVYLDDALSSEVIEFEELVKRSRRQLK